MLFAAKHTVGSQTITIVGVTLGAPAHGALFAGVRALLQQAKAGFQEVKLANVQQAFASYHAPWGERANAVAQKDTAAVIWASTPVNRQVYATALAPSSAVSGEAGSVQFTSGRQRHKTKLVLDKPLHGPSWQWRLLHPRQVIDG